MKSYDLKPDNIVSELNLLLMNIPNNLTPLEKVRWLYIKVGKLFSYDYRIADDLNVAYKEIDFANNYVGRYQTCLQISYLFNLMLNQIDPENIQSNVIERRLDLRGTRKLEHQANEVIISGEKYILDLTLDLYLIQSGCQTKSFAYETDSLNTYEIIPSTDIVNIDEKLGLIDNGCYTDERINNYKDIMNNHNYSNMSSEEIIDYKLNIINSLMKHFNGYFEGKRYVDKLFRDLLKMNYKEFNLTYNHNDMLEMVTCFVIEYNGCERWVIYNSRLGLVNTSYGNIENMLNNGWRTRSNTLNNIHKKVM